MTRFRSEEEWQEEEGGPAFPNTNEEGESSGMSLRDYFAAKALAGILANNECMRQAMRADQGGNMSDEVVIKVAVVSYKYADAMIKAREAK